MGAPSRWRLYLLMSVSLPHGAGLILGLVQWCRLQLQLRYSPWPWNFRVPQAQPKQGRKVSISISMSLSLYLGRQGAHRAKHVSICIFLCLPVFVPTLSFQSINNARFILNLLFSHICISPPTVKSLALFTPCTFLDQFFCV